MKNPMTPAGIEPATFRFVAQHLNHCATAVPIIYCVHNISCTEPVTSKDGADLIHTLRLTQFHVTQFRIHTNFFKQ